MSILNAIKLKDDETVLHTVRRFPLLAAPKFVGGMALMGAAFFMMVPLFRLPTDWLGPAIFLLSIAVGFYLCVRTVVLWYWNAFVITDRRVIDIDQRGILDRVVSEAAFDKIQDVSYRRQGIMGTVFRFGSVLVQTAGATTMIEITGVRHPQEIQHEISEAVAAYMETSTKSSQHRVDGLLEAASALSPEEAKAFLVGLQTAVQRESPASRVTAEDVAAVMSPDED